MDLTISTLTLESFLIVVVRTGCFLAVAPVFSDKAINARLKVLIAVCISVTIFSVMDTPLPVYETVLQYSMLLISEAALGLTMGFVASIIMSMLVMAGEFIDREIGFTMSTTFDPSSGAMVTITAELYNKLIITIMLISNLHYYIIRALVRSFELIPAGNVSMNFPYIYSNVLGFFGQIFVVGFRIAMPIFIGTTMINVILGVLAKSVPQMNMFAVGMQLKVMAGLAVLAVVIMFVPNITTYLVERMQDMVYTIIEGF